jgi:hypothetical protein
METSLQLNNTSFIAGAERKPYCRPAIVLELDLETRAGTGPVGGDVCPGCAPDGFNPSGPFSPKN